MITNAYVMPHPPIIISQIGKGREADAKKTIAGCKAVAEEIAEIKPETIIIITPHGPVFQNALCIYGDEQPTGDFSNFGHPELSYSFHSDTELIEAITGSLAERGIAAVINNEETRSIYGFSEKIDHGALVPLHFINQEYSEYKLVHLTFGAFGPAGLYRCGMAINKAVSETGRKAVLIASSDLSHRLSDEGPYEFDPKGSIYDELVVDCFRKKEFARLMNADGDIRESAGECGHRSMNIAVGVFEERLVETEVHSYEGPFGVGYMTASINGKGPGKSVLHEFREMTESLYVKLARRTIESYVRTGEVESAENPGFEKKGAFVSIKKHGRLRGCIGTIGPTEDCVENEIIYNAVKAAAEDPRFAPITDDELPDLDISVDVLYPPEKIDSRDKLDVKEYGVIVSRGFKRGLLLPNLDGIDTVSEQISIALKKAGIEPDEGYSMERFKVVRYW